MTKVNFPSINGQNITISGVKEQTAGLYASKLAKKGLVTIAFDASYQGESTGEPRQLENPYIRTQDISAVIDYLTTLSSDICISAIL